MGYKEKQRQNVKKSQLSPGKSNARPLALATRALATELQQPTTSKTTEIFSHFSFVNFWTPLS